VQRLQALARQTALRHPFELFDFGLRRRYSGDWQREVVETFAGIQAASQRISEITGVIDGIAFQTNILALNAAVEAARAGEQGRGFAVVASEVRSLAQRSGEAAKQIKQLITESVERIDGGSVLISKVGSNIQEVVSEVDGVSNLISQIASEAAGQTAGVGQIDVALQQLDTTTQQNAALVEQAAAAADSLRQQASALAHAVAAFQLAPRAHMTLLEKDTHLAVLAAQAVGFEGPLGVTAARVFAQASAAGLAGQDDGALLQLLRRDGH
jgi:methyl-accepting chemotaxis protein